MRRFLNRYRFAAITFACTGLLLAGSSLQQSLSYDVNATAVARRYVLRDNYQGDLELQTASLRSSDLTALERRDTQMNPGGFVYTDGSQLKFYRIAPVQAGPTQNAGLNLSTFQGLFSALSKDDYTSFLDIIRWPEVSKRVKGAKLEDRLAIVEKQGLQDPKGRTAAREIITAFVPYGGESYDLERSDELRFYKNNGPQGEYVGAWEFLGFGERLDAQEGIDRAGQALFGMVKGRYIAIAREPTQFVIRDFFDGKEQRYNVPIDR